MCVFGGEATTFGRLYLSRGEVFLLISRTACQATAIHCPDTGLIALPDLQSVFTDVPAVSGRSGEVRFQRSQASPSSFDNRRH